MDRLGVGTRVVSSHLEHYYSNDSHALGFTIRRNSNYDHDDCSDLPEVSLTVGPLAGQFDALDPPTHASHAFYSLGWVRVLRSGCR